MRYLPPSRLAVHSMTLPARSWRASVGRVPDQCLGEGGAAAIRDAPPMVRHGDLEVVEAKRRDRHGPTRTLELTTGDPDHSFRTVRRCQGDHRGNDAPGVRIAEIL